MLHDVITVLSLLALVGALICFFASLKYRTDKGEQAPPFGAVRTSRLRAFYGPRGFKLALAGGICLAAHFALALVKYLLR